MRLSEIRTAYLTHCRAVNFATDTLENYTVRLLDFENVIGNKKIKKITIRDIEAYRAHLLRRGKSPTSIYHYLTSIRSLLKYSEKLGHVFGVTKEQVNAGKCNNPRRVILSKEELSKLLSMPNFRTDVGLRDRAMFELFASSGLRVSELVKLNREDVDFSINQLWVRGKGGKNRIAYFDKVSAVWLKLWLRSRKDDYPALFINLSYTPCVYERPWRDMERLNRNTIGRFLKKYARAAGIRSKITPHVLRHTFATHAAERKMNIKALQEILGHARLSTTEIYLHLANSFIRSEYEQHSAR